MRVKEIVKDHLTSVSTPAVARRRIARGAVVALVVAASMGCGGSDSTSPVKPPTPPGTICTPGNGTVCMTSSNTFDPAAMTIAVGSTVTWINDTGVTHNVTFDTPGSPADIASFKSGAQNATFPSKGTFAYHCTIHGKSMSGTITVQ
jgi:plastocyanin